VLVTPASFDSFGRELSRAAAERLARNWTTVLLNGLLLIVAGVLIFSIDWSVRSLATFIGALFIFEGFAAMLTTGIARRGANIVTGLLSAAVDWWLLLVLGLVELPLGVLALADPGATLAAITTVGGIWALAIGATRVVLAFQLRDLPNRVEKAYAGTDSDGAAGKPPSEHYARA
jgi:uncharacterized membrane protein HdeD (DUF308 family)